VRERKKCSGRVVFGDGVYEVYRSMCDMKLYVFELMIYKMFIVSNVS